MGLGDPVVGSELCFDSSGLMKGDYSVIDYSMQNESFDVGVSLPAACSSAASPVVVLAPAVAASPFPSCGLALSAELRLYPVFCFQRVPTLNFAGCLFAFPGALMKLVLITWFMEVTVPLWFS